jgi:hypothetical protein
MTAFRPVAQAAVQIISAGIVLITKGGGRASYVDRTKSVLDAIYDAAEILVRRPSLARPCGARSSLALEFRL